MAKKASYIMFCGKISAKTLICRGRVNADVATPLIPTQGDTMSEGAGPRKITRRVKPPKRRAFPSQAQLAARPGTLEAWASPVEGDPKEGPGEVGDYFRVAHCWSVSGNRLTCFTPRRGSAIQGATASRQRA